LISCGFGSEARITGYRQRRCGLLNRRTSSRSYHAGGIRARRFRGPFCPHFSTAFATRSHIRRNMGSVDTFCSRIASRRDIMALSKSRLEDRLPRQFPVGAKYVVEGYGGAEGQLRVSARYILLPGGQRINVSGGRASSSNRSRRSPALRVPFKIRSGTAAKNLTGRRGTAARASR